MNFEQQKKPVNERMDGRTGV